VLKVQPANFDTESSSLKSYQSKFRTSYKERILPENDESIKSIHENTGNQPDPKIKNVSDVKDEEMNEDDDLNDFFDSLD